MALRRVVVTGLGCVTPLGVGAGTFWRRALAGESGIGAIANFDSSQFRVQIAGECRDFRPEDFLDARKMRRLDPVVHFGLASAILAARDAGLDVSKENPWRVGVAVGSGIGGLTEIETQHQRLLERGPSKISPFMVPKLMINACAGEISIVFGVKGPNLAVATACATGTHAIGEACNMIRLGYADVMLAGGTEAAVTPLGMGGFCAMNALSRRNDDPAAASRPFDRDRDGFVMGEGAGIIVLEEIQHARARGARVYCEVVGFGMSGDASHITDPDEDGEGAQAAMRAALEDARLDGGRVSYINAHGTSTVKGDISETRGIKTLFGDHARRIAVSSTKSMVGHLLGASGGVEAIAACLSVFTGKVHPTINQENPDPDCDLDYVPNVARDLAVDVALSNSFGFGGHNATLVFAAFRG
ncbi:MAG: beta-ketoacyl-ACP synthase II [Planctomycetota bacterium]